MNVVADSHPDGTMPIIDREGDGSDVSSKVLREMPPQEDKLWRVHATLKRVKRPIRVLENPRGIKPDAKTTQKPGRRLLDPKRPPKLPFDCEDTKCNICFPQFFPATYAVTDREAAKIVNGLVNGITGDLRYLRESLKSQADIIATRWQKKTRAWRQKLLLKNTDIYEKKLAPVHLLNAWKGPTPGWDKFMSDSDRDASEEDKMMTEILSPYFYRAQLEFTATQCYQDTWLLPYLDAETLAEDPLRFLGLLHHLTVNAPEAWLMFDNAQLVMAENLAIIPALYSKHCVVMHGNQFGTLVDWNAAQAHRWEIVGFNKAHYLLTAQRRMMGFLRKVVDALIPQEQQTPQIGLSPPQPKWDELVHEKLSVSATDSAWSTDSVRPFSAPLSFDPHKILEAITARYRAAKDDLDSLQTDPSYVQFLVSQLSSTLFFERVDKKDIWPHHVDELILVPLRRETYWRQLLAECERMVQAFDALRDGTKEFTRDEYDIMLYVVVDCASEFFAMMVTFLDYSLPFQRGLERNFEFADGRDADGIVRKRLTIDAKDSFPDDILFWSLSCMGSDQFRKFTMDPAVNFIALDDYMSKANAKDKARINQRVYDHVSDMAVINEVIFSIRSEKLRNREPPRKLVLACMKEDFRAQWLKKVGNMNPRGLSGSTASYLENACQKNPSPVGKRDRKWLEQADLSRASLRKFWAALRLQYARNLRSAGCSQSFIDQEMEVLSAHNSPEHIAELEQELEELQKQEMAKTLASKAVASEKDAMDMSFSTLQSMHGKENARPTTLPMREKPKTRPDASFKAKSDKDSFETTMKSGPTSVESQPLLAQIPVKAENMRVFINMYPSASDEGRRNIRWQHFLDAMADTGLSISQASGSAVSFAFPSTDKDAPDLGSIVFHRPHPVAEVHPVMMRSIGRRMRKWFGWQRETFVERQKEGEKEQENTV